MYQPPNYPPPQRPKKQSNVGLWILGFLAICVAIVWLFGPTLLNPSQTTAENTINNYEPPGTNDASAGTGSHTNTYFYHSGTPTKGVNGNPWGYDFNPTNGNEIYDDEPVDFCHYFKCTKDFWTNIPLGGYVVECQDGLFSHTGGTKYACSGHSGVKRILYWHV